MWLHFVSYKVGRLLLPWLLIGVALSSLGLPASWRVLAISSQAVFYTVAAADRWIPQASTWKRLSSPARTFVLMMGAALAGLSVFFVPARSLWKVTSAGEDAIPDHE